MASRLRRIGTLAYEGFGIWLLALLIAGALYAALGWAFGHGDDLLGPAALLTGGFLAWGLWSWLRNGASAGGW